MHPIAGTEFSGPKAAINGLFKNKANIICEVEKTAFKLQEKALKLFAEMGMRIRYMNPEAHDKHIAYVSHLSHISSFMLGKTVIEKDVITSYSIHYTKLYDFVFRSGINESDVVGSGQFPFYVVSAYADKRFNQKSALQLGADVRITSYNVCYTKLLRITQQGKPDPLPRPSGSMKGRRRNAHRITSYNVCYTKLLRITRS